MVDFRLDYNCNDVTIHRNVGGLWLPESR
uniref:Uncharacterized protein n=1 Tax=Anguilla anguilla TaxID=7936 RepID=A0A0E9STD0_ANGAN